MHELSLATALVSQVQDIMVKENLRELVSITVAMGALSGVEREAFEFCFPLVVEGTSLVGTKLKITEIPVKLFCQMCKKRSQPEEIYMIRCEKCDSSDVEIIDGRDFIIQSLEAR